MKIALPLLVIVILAQFQPVAARFRNANVIVGSKAPGYVDDYVSASIVAELLDGNIKCDSDRWIEEAEEGKPTVIIGGPLANMAALRFESRFYEIRFWRKGDVNYIQVGAATYRANYTLGEDIAVIAVRDNILLVAGCTRYGTRAACLHLKSSASQLVSGYIVVKWEDLNANMIVEEAEVKVLSVKQASQKESVIVLPDESQVFLNILGSAKKSLWVEVYILTNDEIISIFESSARRGVDVRVILERSPYGAPDINIEAYYRLSASGVSVRWGSSRYPNFHAKFAIIDGETLMVGTANYAYSSLHHNREYVAIVKGDPVQDVVKVFLADWEGEKTPAVSQILVSPGNMRYGLISLIAEARKTILIEAEYITDYEFINMLKQKARSGVTVKVIMEYNEANTHTYRELSESGVLVRWAKGLTMHAKMIVIDGRKVYIGSANFTPTSMDSNRELGVILESEEAISKIINTFNSDWG